MTAIAARQTTGDDRLIRCRTPNCDMILATIGEHGDIYPIAVGPFVDKDGRLTIHCPLCGQRNRLPTKRKMIR